VRADERDDLDPAGSRDRVDRGNAARDVIEVQVLGRREEGVRRREELREARETSTANVSARISEL